MSSFGFQFSEIALRNALAAIEEQKELDPEGTYALEFSTELLPEPGGFEFYNPSANIVKIIEDIELPAPPDVTFMEESEDSVLAQAVAPVGHVTVQEVREP